MGDILPFRPKEPKPEVIDERVMQVYRDWTKNWSDEMKQQIFPEHWAQDNKK